MILYKTKESEVVRVDGGAVKQQNLAKHSSTINGDGVKTVFNINHNLNTTDIIFEMNDGTEQVLIDYAIVDENNIIITFAVAPTTDETYYITIYSNQTSTDMSNNTENDTETDIVVDPYKDVTFTNATDEQLTSMLTAYYNDEIDIFNYIKIGDTRTITLSAMRAGEVSESHESQEVELVVIGIEHDDLTNKINNKTKAALTIHLKNCLNEVGYMNSTDTSINGWNESSRRFWCNNIFKESLPSIINNSIKDVNKVTYEGELRRLISDSCFLLSESEVFGEVTYSYGLEGLQYEYYLELENRKKNVNGEKYSWWLRSKDDVTEEKDLRFCLVHTTNGTPNYYYASMADGLCPAFCL